MKDIIQIVMDAERVILDPKASASAVERAVKSVEDTGDHGAISSIQLTMEMRNPLHLLTRQRHVIRVAKSHATDLLAGVLVKALVPGAKKKGVGSRGGRVIGHTKSGKPVYAPHSKLVAAWTAHRADAGKKVTVGTKARHAKFNAVRRQYPWHGDPLSTHPDDLTGAVSRTWSATDYVDAAAIHRAQGSALHEEIASIHDRLSHKAPSTLLMRKALPGAKKDAAKPFAAPGKASAKKQGAGSKAARYSYPGEKGGAKKPGAPKSTTKPEPGSPAHVAGDTDEDEAPARVVDPVKIDDTPKQADPAAFAAQVGVPLMTIKKVAERFRDNDKLGGEKGYVNFMRTHLKDVADKHDLTDDYWRLLYRALTQAVPAPAKQA